MRGYGWGISELGYRDTWTVLKNYFEDIILRIYRLRKNYCKRGVPHCRPYMYPLCLRDTKKHEKELQNNIISISIPINIYNKYKYILCELVIVNICLHYFIIFYYLYVYRTFMGILGDTDVHSQNLHSLALELNHE